MLILKIFFEKEAMCWPLFIPNTYRTIALLFDSRVLLHQKTVKPTQQVWFNNNTKNLLK